MEGIRIYFRKHQLYDSLNANQPVVVSCGTIASYVPGTVDQTWYEMTEWTEGLEKMQVSWDAVNVNSESNEAGSNYDKGISSTLTFSCDAFNFIWDYLLDNACGVLNSIDVKIVDVICGKELRLFEIKCDNLVYRPEERGMISVTLREQDLTWHCVHKTMIWDNWNGFATTKDHPAFVTCIEPRPRLVSSARMGLLIFFHSNPAVNAIDFFTANDIMDDGRRILNTESFIPSPLIRDYIDNVTSKCGLTSNTIFHRAGTPEFNACIFHPQGGKAHLSSHNNKLSPSLKLIDENNWFVTLADLLDMLKKVYCAEWYIEPSGVLVFKPLTESDTLTPVVDFTTGDHTVEDLEYTFSGTKKSAYGRYEYTPDGADMGSQEIADLYNDIVDYDGPTNNPMLEGEKTKLFPFAPTAFVRDGKTRDYTRMLIDDGQTVAFILLGILSVLVGAAVAGTLSAGMAVAIAGIIIGWASGIRNKAIELRREFAYGTSTYTGTVRMVQSNTALAPRILIWDGVNKSRAKVVKSYLPAPELYYNPSGKSFPAVHDISINNDDKSIYNYPAYFDSQFQNNLFHRFHDKIDNPLKSLETNQEFKFSTELCCDVATALGVWKDGRPAIGYLVKIERREGYDVFGRITRISLNYDNYTIELRGVVIKRSA